MAVVYLRVAPSTCARCCDGEEGDSKAPSAISALPVRHERPLNLDGQPRLHMSPNCSGQKRARCVVIHTRGTLSFVATCLSDCYNTHSPSNKYIVFIMVVGSVLVTG
jgi:hypothetical protein